MRILVLGDSASAGQVTGGRGFGHVFRDRLAADRGEDVGFEHESFLLTGEGAARYARKLVDRHSPDIVILAAGSYLFSAGFVWLRVKRLFGGRAGRLARQLELRFDAATNRPGRVRPRVNALVRGIARRVIGTETITTWEESAWATAETLRELARSEDLCVLVMSYGSRAGYGDTPGRDRTRVRYVEAVRAAAAEHRHLFVDPTAAYAPGTQFSRVSPNDRLHRGSDFHEAIGRHAYELFREHMAGR